MTQTQWEDRSTPLCIPYFWREVHCRISLFLGQSRITPTLNQVAHRQREKAVEAVGADEKTLSTLVSNFEARAAG